MKLLIFGGTLFLSKAVAAHAVERGHDVTCACRGESGAIPDGARLVRIDRGRDDPAVIGTEFDAVLDVARTPSWVRAAVAAIPDAAWIFVSSISAYSDHATPGGTPATTSLHEPLHDDADELTPVTYGGMKVACEELVAAGTASNMIVRPGLIVGPGDPSGRFTYWPARLARDGGSAVLAPGAPDRRVQVVDVRDLAAWLVVAAEQQLTGVYDAVGPIVPMSELLDEVARGVGASPSFTWVDQDVLVANDVNPWGGPRSIPLWVPQPDYDGMLTHDPAPASGAGLVTRPIADSAADTLAWLRQTPAAEVTGLTADEEAAVLAAANG